MGANYMELQPGAQVPPRLLVNHHAKGFSKRKKANVLALMRRRIWTFPLILTIAMLSLYAINPTESNPTYHFIFPSYKLENDSGNTTQYGKGPWDIAFVCFYTVVLTFTREVCMQEMLGPLARVWGIKSRAKRARFAENMYTALYVTAIAPWGMHVMSRTPVWYFNTHGMYADFPHRTHDASFKCYYLLQAAFWAQQVVVMVLGLEQRRKDFQELVAHHVVTVALVALSYRFHFAYMGIAVYITHDISDFFLAVSKSLNYLENRLQGVSFGVCIAVWIYLRHYINLRILYSALPGSEFSTVGPYELNWETEQYKCPLSNVITFGLLAALQALNLFWLYCLLRSAYKFVFLGVAKDDRSEDEEESVIQPSVQGEEPATVGISAQEVEKHRKDFPSRVTGNGAVYMQGPLQGRKPRKTSQ
ncbi:TLC domain-containing protein [Colletotrichum graminicola]|uniref:TLC domain-containing protein n=1 Tax=Colletotrichum graminicola (strain M1.001 / M2 / FGSC 10212) TaxID=645133 RepID=E3QN53_COLGM|nr:TLC domain-containing protein [Colletotrichum graminicola M1.001]EFQ32291.1 TLC domain-containing protein [Colletotrichum graminicola M1.001]WDK19865.1 TLC domain-containing protein [Colletotrichum graminicola]